MTLEMLDDFVGMRDLCEEARRLNPSAYDVPQKQREVARASTKKMTEARQCYPDNGMADLQASSGFVYHEQYPFVALKHIHRTKETIHAAQRALEATSNNCVIALRKFLGALNKEVEGFGVYATEDVNKLGRLFEDPTIFGATNTRSTAPTSPGDARVCDNCCGALVSNTIDRVLSTCCSAVYRSEQCHLEAMRSYHRPLCGQNFDWLYKDLKTNHLHNLPEFNGPLWLRVLSACIQEGCHPLDHPLNARLSMTLGSRIPRKWTFRHNIIVPTRILEQLGVDVFKIRVTIRGFCRI